MGGTSSDMKHGIRRILWLCTLQAVGAAVLGCRAGTSTAFTTGPTFLRGMANYHVSGTCPSNCVGSPARALLPVGSFPPNAWSVYDMHGNSRQWCSDCWTDDYSSATATGPNRAPTGRRVRRGGSCIYRPEVCRSAYHDSNTADTRSLNDGFGFRVALSAGPD